MNPETAISRQWTNRALFSLLWPLVIEQLLAVAMGAADTIMVSWIGEYAVSGVNVIDNINNLLIIAFTALCTGGAVVVSQYIGRKDYANSCAAAKQLIYSVAVISVLIMVLAVTLRRPIITLFYGKIADDVMDAASAYFLFTGLSYPFLALATAGAALYRAAGNSRTPMLIALLVNVLHIGGNVLFIYVMEFGVMGAALSTFISRVVVAAIAILMLYRGRNSPVSLQGLFSVRIARPMIRNILNVGLPSGIESSMFMVGKLLTQRIFAIFGTAAIAANAITGMINSFTFMPGSAFGIALLTVVGQCIGAGDYAEAKKLTFKIMKLAYIVIFIVSALTYIFMDPLLALFNLGDEAYGIARSILKIHCFSMAIGWAMSFVLPNSLRAAGDARFAMIVSTVSMWTVRVCAAYFFAFTLKLGPLGVWLAMGADFLVRGAFFCLRWIRGKWQDKRVITN